MQLRIRIKYALSVDEETIPYQSTQSLTVVIID